MLYRYGAYRQILPLYARAPGNIRKRLLAYLEHYLRSVAAAEATLDLPPLRARFACDLNDHMLFHYLRNEAPIYEIAEIDFFRQQARTGDYLLDIGANHGFWGIGVAVAAGPSSRLYLFEANPKVARRVRRSLCLNETVNGRVHEIAVTDGTAERVRFYRPQGNLSGLGSTVLHDYASQNGYLVQNDYIEVAARSLDQLMDQGEIRGMDMVKIDVEQAEDAVIAGAMRALERFQPRILMVETSAASNATRALCSLGYTATALDSAGKEQELSPGHWGNLVFRRCGA